MVDKQSQNNITYNTIDSLFQSVLKENNIPTGKLSYILSISKKIEFIFGYKTKKILNTTQKKNNENKNTDYNIKVDEVINVVDNLNSVKEKIKVLRYWIFSVLSNKINGNCTSNTITVSLENTIKNLMELIKKETETITYLEGMNVIFLYSIYRKLSIIKLTEVDNKNELESIVDQFCINENKNNSCKNENKNENKNNSCKDEIVTSDENCKRCQSMTDSDLDGLLNKSLSPKLEPNNRSADFLEENKNDNNIPKMEENKNENNIPKMEEKLKVKPKIKFKIKNFKKINKEDIEENKNVTENEKLDINEILDIKDTERLEMDKNLEKSAEEDNLTKKSEKIKPKKKFKIKGFKKPKDSNLTEIESKESKESKDIEIKESKEIKEKIKSKIKFKIKKPKKESIETEKSQNSQEVEKTIKMKTLNLKLPLTIPKTKQLGSIHDSVPFKIKQEELEFLVAKVKINDSVGNQIKIENENESAKRFLDVKSINSLEIGLKYLKMNVEEVINNLMGVNVCNVSKNIISEDYAMNNTTRGGSKSIGEIIKRAITKKKSIIKSDVPERCIISSINASKSNFNENWCSIQSFLEVLKKNEAEKTDREKILEYIFEDFTIEPTGKKNEFKLIAPLKLDTLGDADKLLVYLLILNIITVEKEFNSIKQQIKNFELEEIFFERIKDKKDGNLVFIFNENNKTNENIDNKDEIDVKKEKLKKMLKYPIIPSIASSLSKFYLSILNFLAVNSIIKDSSFILFSLNLYKTSFSSLIANSGLFDVYRFFKSVTVQSTLHNYNINLNSSKQSNSDFKKCNYGVAQLKIIKELDKKNSNRILKLMKNFLDFTKLREELEIIKINSRKEKRFDLVGVEIQMGEFRKNFSGNLEDYNEIITVDNVNIKAAISEIQNLRAEIKNLKLKLKEKFGEEVDDEFLKIVVCFVDYLESCNL